MGVTHGDAAAWEGDIELIVGLGRGLLALELRAAGGDGFFDCGARLVGGAAEGAALRFRELADASHGERYLALAAEIGDAKGLYLLGRVRVGQGGLRLFGETAEIFCGHVRHSSSPRKLLPQMSRAGQ
jgi:hypothetical protein